MANTLPGTPYVESSDLVANYPAVSESLAERVDLVGVLPFATSTARGTALPTPTDGQYSYLQDSNTTEFWNGSAWQNVSKILQVVRATDATNRSTTSTSFVDASLSVTITPVKSDSRILVISSCWIYADGATADRGTQIQITDSSNNALSGASGTGIRFINLTYGEAHQTIIGYDTPASTAAKTYKTRFRAATGGTTAGIMNTVSNSQMYAIEVSA